MIDTGKPSPPYLIRPADRTDAPALAAIEEASFDKAAYGGFLMSGRAFRRHILSANFLLVAVSSNDAGTIAGYALGLVRKDSRYVRFISLAVLPEHGGRGAAWRLFDAIEKAACNGGYRGVRLEIRADNTRLQARYLRDGYSEFARVPDYYPDGTAAIRMVKEIQPTPLAVSA